MDSSPPWGLVDAARVVARTGSAELAVAAIAAGQHGLITVQQLLYVGIGRGAISYRRRLGRLHTVHRGVFAVGYPKLTPVGRLAAAVLACGPTAVISHRWAGALWELLAWPLGERVHISSTVHLRRRDGIAVHRSASVIRQDVRRREGLPVTSPARTLLELAETEPLSILERALNEARVRGLVNQAAFSELASRTNGRTGWGPLGEIFRGEGAPGFSRSRAEKVLWDLIRKHRPRLPLPLRNARVHGHELDFYWPDARLNVETDGRAAHGTGLRFETDRDRDAHLASFGIRVMRFTWKQLSESPDLVVARISAALGAGGEGRGP